jgi:hypothetical protein
MKLKKAYEFPIRTYQKLETDPMNGILSALGKLTEEWIESYPNPSSTCGWWLAREDQKESENWNKIRLSSYVMESTWVAWSLIDIFDPDDPSDAKPSSETPDDKMNLLMRKDSWRKR